jgi:hypothetical protein
MTSKVAVDEDLKSPRLATDLLRAKKLKPIRAGRFYSILVTKPSSPQQLDKATH